MTRLPPPEQYVLLRMNNMEVAEMIEEHIDFVEFDKSGGARSVHLPTPFVSHYRQRRDGKLPTVVAIATLPIVLADGKLLAPDGLDRLRGIIFEIPKELIAIIPRKWTDRDVCEAMKYLCDVWLCDVATDYTGKCIIIAAALTIIERSLLPDRPVFFVTAGRRGGGKTTTLIMLIMAVTGLRPAAAAWSTVEEERRKALLSYFIYGTPYILWDNIPRGTQVSCPHIEKSCTSAFYIDRKLGVSETVATAAAAIHLFTGNNINPKGDLASRSLHVRIKVDRPDPENREFRHPDPVGWTEHHRAEILASLYTIMLANPMLNQPRDAPCQTRFKLWWRLIGSAVEHAARLNGREVEFKDLFIDQEEEDEESASLAEALAVMLDVWPKGFKAEEVAKLANQRHNKHGLTLREFLFPATPPSFDATPKAVAKRLAHHLDEPVWSGERQLTLKSFGARNRAMKYFVHVK
jgi:hypothetical protein